MTRKPVRIAFVDNVCDPKRPGRSGHSDIIWSLASKFAEHGYNTSIIGPYFDNVELPFVHHNISVIRFKEHPLASKNSFGMAANAHRAAKASVGKNFDYIFTSDAFSAGIVSLEAKKSKVIFITSGNILQRQASDFKLDFLAEISYRIVSYYAARLTYKIVATSHDMSNWWTKTGAKKDKIAVIPLGVKSDDFNKISLSRDSKKLNLLFVGRLEGENNPLMLVEIASQLKNSGVDFTLTIIGDGSFKEELNNRLISKSLLNLVHIHGAAKFQDLPDIYSKNHIFLYTRQAGAPPRVIIQALMSGLCVIAFNTSGLEDYVLNLDMGILVPYGDIDMMVSSIVKLNIDRAFMLTMSENARKRASETFDWNSIYTRYSTEIFGDAF